MNAETVYTVFKALPQEERLKLYTMLKQDYDIELPKSNKRKTLEFSDSDALKYMYDNLF